MAKGTLKLVLFLASISWVIHLISSQTMFLQSIHSLGIVGVTLYFINFHRNTPEEKHLVGEGLFV